MKISKKIIINSILLFLIFFDFILVIWGFFFPDFWFSFFHNSEYTGVNAFFFRAVANWLAFLIIQILAFVFWGKYNFWLILVAGCRLGDTLTDIACLFFSSKISFFGLILYPAAGLGNLITGILLIKLFLDIKKKYK